jgi:hypothetical protein
MSKGTWAKRSVVAAVCVGVAMVATPSWAEQLGESSGTRQLEFDVGIGVITNDRPGQQRFEMGDARTTGARYLDPATPPNRVQAAISDSDYVLVSPRNVNVERKPAVSRIPTSITLWKWLRGERLPIEVSGVAQCAGPQVSWDCFSSNQNRNAFFDLPDGQENRFYTQWETPVGLSWVLPQSSVVRDGQNAVVFTDGLGSTVWTTMKLRSQAQWLATEGDVNTDYGPTSRGTENLYSAMQKGVYVGPELPVGTTPSAISRSGRTVSATIGAWELPPSVQFHDRTLVAFDCKDKEAGQAKKAVSLEKDFGCKPLGVAYVLNEPGKYEVRLSQRPRFTLVIEDWLSVRGKRFEKGQIPSQWMEGERDMMSGLTMQERELYIDQIPPMRFVTRAAVS